MENNNSYGLRSTVLRELSDGFFCIYDNFKYFKKLSKSNESVLGAAEWLLDNIYLIEKEYKSIKSGMPFDYFKGLPASHRTIESQKGLGNKKGLGNNKEFNKNEDIIPHIFEVAKDYINQGGEIELAPITEYINNIQDKKEFFTMGELWAFPLMLRISIMLNLAKYTDELVDVQKDLLRGKRLANVVIDAINNDKLQEELESIDDKYEKFSALFLREFFKTLRDNSVEDDSIYKFAKLKLGMDTDLDNTILKSGLREESLKEHIGEYITCIRKIEGMSWRNFFEDTSIVEKTLLEDPEHVYENMDFKSKDYYRHKLEQISRSTSISEVDLANEVLDLSKKAKTNNEESYKCHVGYYLIDKGIKDLKGYYHNINDVISEGTYLALNILGTLVLAFIILLIFSMFGARFTKIQYIVSFLMILNPINEIIIALINWSVSKFIEIRLVPKLDLSKGIPDEDKSIVVIPAIVNSKERVKALMEQLEVAYCGNKDKNIYFALLSDFNDSSTETEEKDSEIIKAGIEYSRILNEKYNDDRFFFLSRKRIYNKKQGVYMGKERKRGKLMEFIALIRGSHEHTYNIISSDIKVLKEVKYLITLDADTFMPRESAFRLIGAMSHVLNTPYIEKDRVTRGYGIMQPKVTISLEAKNKTYFSRIFGGEGGVDGYSVAYSDTYQDLFGEGSFTGKGIINIDAFYSVLKNSIKDNKVLSHDLIEGAFARCALVSDVEFIDGYPAYYESSSRRLHRWTRGDWQLVGWLFSRKINSLYKWKIFDNLRRSLLAPNLLIALILTLTVLKGSSQIALLCFLGLMVSLVFTVTDFVVTPKNKLMGTFKNFEQIVLIVTFIPYTAFLMIDAILITLFRVCISKRNLLEWESSETVERTHSNSFKAYLKRMWISPIMGLLVLYLSFSGSFAVVTYNTIVAGLWIVSPYVAYSISKKIPKYENSLENEEKSYLREISRRIWAYYEDFVNEENNYLAPDNYQEKPFKGVAHRTSPTNIGMGLISNVVAYDLGYIPMSEFIERVDLILSNMKDLKTLHGHYLNWYDTKTKEPLWPRYISTVDSGNILGHLWIVKKAMEELKNNSVIRVEEIEALNDIYKIIESEDSSISIRFASNINIGEYLEILNEILFKLQGFKNEESDVFDKIGSSSTVEESSNNNHKTIFKSENKEVEYWIGKLINEVKKKIDHYNYIFKGIEKLYSDDFLEGVPNITELVHRAEEFKENNGDNFNNILIEKLSNFKGYLNKIDKIIEEINIISEEMDFKFLYDNTRGLFSIGYNVEEDSLGNSYYDLLASEARAASFIAIAKNDVPNSHWFKLSRAMTNAFRTHSLVSWSGTMFEYFMPSLIMKSYPRTLLSQTYKSVIKAQKIYAKQKKTPWGISESAFYEFDVQDNYQYKAFGIPGLGLKRGLEDEIVISPYSTLMTLPFTKKSSIKNLKKLEKIGALGRYGFIESLDYTKARGDNYVLTTCEINMDKSVDKVGDNVDNFTKGINKVQNIRKSYPQYLVENNPQSINKDVNSRKKYGDIYRKIDEIPDEEINLDGKFGLNKGLDMKDRAENENFVNEYGDGFTSHNISEKRKRSKFQKNIKKISDEEVLHDGIKPNKVVTYMVHHLGMSFMALDNVLKDNTLINRFHSLPEVKSTELLLKEKIPQNVVFEREEDFSLKNKYIEGERLIPRIFEGIKYENPEILLLSNGEYSSMITLTGSGYSKRNDMMLYRWKGDSTSDDSGLFFYIKNLNSNDYWSATYEPCKDLGDGYNAEFNLDKAKFNRKDGNIETQMEVVISSENNFEVRKLTLNNLGDKGRSLEVTSYMEITLTAFSADAVHPAFSNLFIQTEYNEKENVLIGSRRGRVKGAKVPYIFHKSVVNGEMEGQITYETSRLDFIGRNRELKYPAAMDNDKALDNKVGTVLDPIMSLRTRVRLEPHEQKEIYYITGTCDSMEDVLEICRENNDIAKLERVFSKYTIGTQLELKNLGIKSSQGNLFQKMASYIFFVHSGRQNREEYIKNISKYQKDLWAYGISGDLPIILVSAKSEDDINSITTMLKFHYYLKLKGVKTDLIIYNNEETSYDEPFQKSILQAINTSNEVNSINISGGIFLHNKSTMTEEIKDLLIGIARLYVDSEKGSILNQIKEIEERNSILTKDGDIEELDTHLNSHRLDEMARPLKSNKVAETSINLNEVNNNINGWKDDEIENEEKNNEIEFVEDENIFNIEEFDEEEINNDDSNLEDADISDSINDSINDINYDEYDHDEEIIHAEDLISGLERPEVKDKNNEELNRKLSDKPNSNNKSNEVNNSYSEDLKNNKNNYIEDDFDIDDLDFFNGYGGFNKKDKSYVIKLSNFKNTPVPWINVISNDDFGFHISESGSSYTWCGNSRENKITPWSNDYVRDPMGEALYIRDNISGKSFSITPKPIRDSGEYLIKHSFGYSEFKHTAYDIKGKLEVFTPRGEKLKIQKVTLENLSHENREISLFYYAKLVLGVYDYESTKYISTYIQGSGDVEIDYRSKELKNIDTESLKVSQNLSHLKDKENLKDNEYLKYSDSCSEGYIYGTNPYSEYFGKLNAYLTILGGEDLSFTGDRKEFIGLGGEVSSPEALKYKRLSNRCGGIYDPCLAASASIKLEPGEKKEVLILFGEEEKGNIEQIINKYKIKGSAETELDKVKQYWSHFLGNIQVKTPDKSLDYLLNGWLLYQTLSCRYLSRTAFYQSGGAYGFRDQLQDSIALGVVEPEITKAQILRSASRQYVEGDVQHWWHPVVNSGIRTRFSDDLLWLPYVTAEYINSTGDYDILNSKAPYLEDEPLREGEDERYTIVNQSSKEGTIYEHCLKAIEKSLKFGVHNIPLMGSGDWNDGMSTVGNEGKGESIWLGWFLYSILGSFIEIAETRNDEKTKKHYEEKREFIRENMEKNAWDGGWYRRAYFDDGTPLGSRENPECQIDSLAQSWAIISGATKIRNKTNENNKNNVGNKYDINQINKMGNISRENSISKKNNPGKISSEDSINNINDLGKISGESYEIEIREREYSDRAIEAMEAVDKNLVKKDKGMILLLAPPFSNSYLEPGYIKGYVPGVRENGGQYTHAAVWVILALTKLGLGDKAVKYYNMINPINHTNTELECKTYKLEPYVMAADVYIKEPHGGRGGWSWYTGASGWMYRVGIENILGLRKVKDKGYIVDPCIPKEWNEFEIKIKNEKEDYTINVIRIYKGIKNINSNNNVKCSIDSAKSDKNINSKDDLNSFEFKSKNEIEVVINGKISKDKIIPRNSGKLEIKVYLK